MNENIKIFTVIYLVFIYFILVIFSSKHLKVSLQLIFRNVSKPVYI